MKLRQVVDIGRLSPLKVSTSRLRFATCRPIRVTGVVAFLLVSATAVCAGFTLGSDATASRMLVARSHPALTILSSPKVQTIETKIVAKTDAKTHTGKPALVLG